MHLTGRTLSREFMDDPAADRAELAQALHYLRFINRRLGGTAAALSQFKRWSRQWRPGEIVRIIDLGTGSADIPLALAAWADRSGFALQITGVDAHPVTVELAREHVNAQRASAARSSIEIIHADALRLMDQFSAGSFDYAHAGLFLHHFTDVQVITLLRIMDRLTTRGLIWNDLLRSTVARLGVRLLTFGPRVPSYVRHDALVSVEAGFTRTEAFDLAKRAGCQRLSYRTRLLHRFMLVSDKSHAGASHTTSPETVVARAQ